MASLMKSAAAALAVATLAVPLATGAAKAGVVSLSDEQAVRPDTTTQLAHWSRYCHRHYWRHAYWRPHYRYYGYYEPVYRYEYTRPYYSQPYGYYGWGNTAATAATDSVLFPFSVFTGWW